MPCNGDRHFLIVQTHLSTHQIGQVKIHQYIFARCINTKERLFHFCCLLAILLVKLLKIQQASIAQSVERLPGFTLPGSGGTIDLFRSPPMPACRYMEENSSVAMLAAKRSAGVTPEVNCRECVTYMPLTSVNKTAHSGFETQRRHHQKSKT